ncbi:hypothetical protein CERSUDRAFT_127309 [Gelatoporia subvermispora B]|uniref:Uncharacterized protein n=1 Tax=Ceriporiopsis subvermispora (strain B) TaxID=914234 RepID=M2P891_CERS8|nr:hypothetical protein CERSUDRAFT_127309 [Gelatoporia subvermispora B]
MSEPRQGATGGQEKLQQMHQPASSQALSTETRKLAPRSGPRRKIKYWGSPWSLKRLRESAWQILGLEATPWKGNDDKLRRAVLKYFVKSYTSSEVGFRAVIYDKDEEVRRAYAEFITEVADKDDQQICLVLIFSEGRDYQGVGEPVLLPEKIRKELDTILGPPRWWEIITGTEDEEGSDVTWYDPHTGQPIESEGLLRSVSE